MPGFQSKLFSGFLHPSSKTRSLLQRNQPMLKLELATVRLPAAEVEPSQPTIPGNNLKSYSPLGSSEFNHPAHGMAHLQQRNTAPQNLVSACSRNLRLLRLPSSSASNAHHPPKARQQTAYGTTIAVICTCADPLTGSHIMRMESTNEMIGPTGNSGPQIFPLSISTYK
jgi:hypothetical protein